MKDLILFLSILVFAACTNNQEGQPRNNTDYLVENKSVAEPVQDYERNPQIEPIIKTGISRKLIKEGNVEFETSDVEKTKKHIMASVSSIGAYISSDQEHKFPDKLSYTIIVRIPAAKFDSFLATATKGVSYFDQKEINVRDVTAEYLDNESRMKTKRGIESRYMQLLGKASTVKDILNIEKELGAIRTEIESAEGQLKYLKDRVEYSTLRITFYKMTSTPALFSHQVSSAFVQGWENLLAFLVLVIDVWPFLLLLPVFWIGARKIWRRRAGRKATVV